MKLRKAVLIIHGFAGGTYDEERLAFYLTMHNYDVFTFTLPGHDKIFFNKVTKDDWIDSCRNHIEKLSKNGYKNIYVIGHSMGGILASYLAANYNEVKKLVLIAPAFKYLTFEENDLNVMSVIKNSPKICEDYGTKTIFSRMLQFPTSVIKEFMHLVDISKEIPSKVSCSTLIIQGDDDKIVPIESSEFVFKHLNTKKKYLKIIHNLTHDVFRCDEDEAICNMIYKFLRFGVCSNGKNK